MWLLKQDFYNDASLWVMKNLRAGLVNEEGKVMMGSGIFMILTKASSEIMRLRLNVEYQ